MYVTLTASSVPKSSAVPLRSFRRRGGVEKLTSKRYSVLCSSSWVRGGPTAVLLVEAVMEVMAAGRKFELAEGYVEDGSWWADWEVGLGGEVRLRPGRTDIIN